VAVAIEGSKGRIKQKSKYDDGEYINSALFIDRIPAVYHKEYMDIAMY
jgi:hypothetical protein